jgi:hypothetical protein
MQSSAQRESHGRTSISLCAAPWVSTGAMYKSVVHTAINRELGHEDRCECVSDGVEYAQESSHV